MQAQLAQTEAARGEAEQKLAAATAEVAQREKQLGSAVLERTQSQERMHAVASEAAQTIAQLQHALDAHKRENARLIESQHRRSHSWRCSVSLPI